MMEITILELVRKAECENITQIELNSLIKYCYNIALSSIKSRLTKYYSYNFDNGFSFESLASDAIVPLFIKNGKHKFGLKRSIELWNDPIESNSDAEYFLSRIIWKRVEQTISQFFKDNDPIFDKIHRTLTTCISINQLAKVRYFGTFYILENRNTTINGKLLNKEGMDALPNTLFLDKQLELFNKIFDYIKTNTDYFPAIPFNLLIKRIKYNYFLNYKENFEDCNYNNSILIYSDLINEALKTVNDKLETFYVTKNKLSRKDADLVMAAFDDISKDLMNGGIHESLFNYLSFRKSDMSKEEFYSKYQNIMNYLLTGFKKKISEKFLI